MRIFQLNTFCGIKSTGRITTEIAKLVEADGGACLIGFGAEQAPTELSRFAYRIGTPVERKLHGALRKLFDGEGYGSQLGTKQLIAKIEAFQPDLIHLHNLHGCYVNLRMLFRYLAKADIPVVWTLHDCWPFTGHCAYFDYAQCEKWQTICHHCPQQGSYPICLGMDGSKRNYAHKKKLFTALRHLTFVAPCEWMKQPLSHSFLGSHPVRVIPNGVNRQMFRPIEKSMLRERFHLQNKQIVLSVASEWDERKGLKFLWEAARSLGEDYCFVVIGLSQEQIAALPDGMLGIEHTKNAQELADWYSTADCLANPTLEDNMPLVNLEALSCGTPVAVFCTGGCPEALDASCGLVVEKGDVAALCKAIQTLCAQKASMRTACLLRAEAFDSERTFQAYLNLYKELCQ
ncbi:MAG: glycosyltransferase [Clostridia bacterium]